MFFSRFIYQAGCISLSRCGSIFLYFFLFSAQQLFKTFKLSTQLSFIWVWNSFSFLFVLVKAAFSVYGLQCCLVIDIFSLIVFSNTHTHSIFVTFICDGNAIEFDTNPWITIENEIETKLMFWNCDSEQTWQRRFHYIFRFETNTQKTKHTKIKTEKNTNAADWWNNWDINCIFILFLFFHFISSNKPSECDFECRSI